MESIPQRGDVVASPEQRAIDVLSAAVVEVVSRVEGYKQRQIKSAEVPLAWEDFDDHNVTVSVWAGYNAELFCDRSAQISEQEFETSSDFMLNVCVNYEVNPLPPEAVAAAKRAGVEADFGNAICIDVEHELNVSFGMGELAWREERTYLVVTEDSNKDDDADGRIRISVLIDEFENEIENNEEIQGTPFDGEGTAVDELNVMFEAMNQEVIAARIERQVARILRFIEAVKKQQPVRDLAFAHPDAA